MAKIGEGLELSRIVEEVDYSSAVGRCSFVVGRYSFAGEQLELEQGLGLDNCSFELEQLGVELGLNDHLLGILDCSIFHHKIHRQIGLRCHIDQRSYVELDLVDIEAEQAEE